MAVHHRLAGRGARVDAHVEALDGGVFIDALLAQFEAQAPLQRSEQPVWLTDRSNLKLFPIPACNFVVPRNTN